MGKTRDLFKKIRDTREHYANAFFKKNYLFGSAVSQLQYAGSLVVEYATQFPNQESNLNPLHWEYGILAIGPPGQYQESTFLTAYFMKSKHKPDFEDSVQKNVKHLSDCLY